MNEMLTTILAWLVVAFVGIAGGAVVTLCGYSLDYEEGKDNGKA